MSLTFQEYTNTTRNEIITVPTGKSTHVMVLHSDASITFSFETQADHAEMEIYALCLATKDSALTCSLQAQLLHSHCSANIHIVTLYASDSDAQIDGGVTIHPDIVKAQGHLLEENIIIGENVTIKTLPMLDVRSNDVQASHGARIEKLDPAKQFYLQSKGLPKEQATQLMIQGYIEALLEPAKEIASIDTLAQRYLHLLRANG